MFIDCMLRALQVSWLYFALIAIVFIIIIVIIIIIIIITEQLKLFSLEPTSCVYVLNVAIWNWIDSGILSLYLRCCIMANL